MTRILVLSDTHLTRGNEQSGAGFKLMEDLAGYFHEVDLILHAGDHTGISFFHDLQEQGELVSVCGNMDSLPLQCELPERIILEREGVRIGLMHGWGSARNLEDRIYMAWQDDKPDIMIFGHSHQAHLSHRGKLMLFNPGSPTSPRGQFTTAGWLEIDDGVVEARLIQLPKNGEYPKRVITFAYPDSGKVINAPRTDGSSDRSFNLLIASSAFPGKNTPQFSLAEGTGNFLCPGGIVYNRQRIGNNSAAFHRP